MSVTVKKSVDTKVFMEGPEVCRLYFKSEKITFGSSTLLPGQTGDVDTGHAESEEIFYVACGHVLLNCGGDFYELFEGDAVCIPPTVPHQLSNIGEKKAIVTWSMAPSE